VALAGSRGLLWPKLDDLAVKLPDEPAVAPPAAAPQGQKSVAGGPVEPFPLEHEEAGQERKGGRMGPGTDLTDGAGGEPLAGEEGGARRPWRIGAAAADGCAVGREAAAAPVPRLQRLHLIHAAVTEPERWLGLSTASCTHARIEQLAKGP